jgi:hypothetical protein
MVWELDGGANGEVEGPREEAGGGERQPNQILLQEIAYVPSSNPKAKTIQERMNTHQPTA